MMPPRRSTLIHLLLIYLTTLPKCIDASGHTYQIGESVPLITKCSSTSTVYEATRSQAPKFGLDGETTLLFRDICPGSTRDRNAKVTLQLSFGNGLYTLPRFELMKSSGSTEVTIQFHHTSDANGQIHSISQSKQEETTSDNNPNDSRINAGKVFITYKWVEEEDVDLAGGLLVMFFAIFGMSLYQIVVIVSSVDEQQAKFEKSYGQQQLGGGAYQEDSQYSVSGGYGGAKRA